MTVLDLTAIYRLIDFYSEDQDVRDFESLKVYTLEEYLNLYMDNNWNLSIDEYNVTAGGKIIRKDDSVVICEIVKMP
jgi:hypothetical protein